MTRLSARDGTVAGPVLQFDVRISQSTILKPSGTVMVFLDLDLDAGRMIGIG